jgi:hypothetical protein
MLLHVMQIIVDQLNEACIYRLNVNAQHVIQKTDAKSIKTSLKDFRFEGSNHVQIWGYSRDIF